MSTIHNLNARAKAIGEMFGVSEDAAVATHPLAGFIAASLVSIGVTTIAIELTAVVVNTIFLLTGWAAFSYVIWIIGVVAAFLGGLYVGSMAGEYVGTGRFHKDVNSAVASTKNFFASKFGKKAA